MVRVVLQREGVEVDEARPCSRASSSARPPPASRCRPRAAPSPGPSCPTGKPPGPGHLLEREEDAVAAAPRRTRSGPRGRGPRARRWRSWMAAPSSRSISPEFWGKPLSDAAGASRGTTRTAAPPHAPPARPPPARRDRGGASTHAREVRHAEHRRRCARARAPRARRRAPRRRGGRAASRTLTPAQVGAWRGAGCRRACSTKNGGCRP